MLVARRCSSGCAPWPDDDEYQTCPICLEATVRFCGLTPLPPAEAEKRKLYGEFERYYEQEHIQDRSPLTDDELRNLGIELDS